MNYHTAYFALARRGRSGPATASRSTAPRVGSAPPPFSGAGLGAEVIAIAAGPTRCTSPNGPARTTFSMRRGLGGGPAGAERRTRCRCHPRPRRGERFDQSVRMPRTRGRLIRRRLHRRADPQRPGESDPASGISISSARLGSLPGRQTIAVHRDAARARRDDRLRIVAPIVGADISP